MTFPVDQLKLAFAYHIVRQIVGADGEFGAAEQRWIARAFPPTTLETSGFLDRNLLTMAFERALETALVELPQRLTLEEKLDLLETFLDASLADEQLHHTEGSLIVKAAELLGVPPDALDKHLDTLDSVGSVELDSPIEAPEQ